MIVGPPAIADHCEKPCKTETAACIRDRCTALTAESRNECIETCRAIGGCAAIRTLAYVWNECRSDARGVTFRRELRIRRGNCAPVTIQTIGPTEPRPDPHHLCELYGATADGQDTALLGGFQRLAVAPDGSGVVFEVSNGTVIQSVFGGFSPELSPDEEGFFFLRADGKGGRRRLGPASRVPVFQIKEDRDAPFGLGYDILGPLPLNIAFSRDGRTIVYTDLGPGPNGEAGVQVVTLDIASGRRTQLTFLPNPEEGEVNGARFVNADTIVFVSGSDLGEPLHFYAVKTSRPGVVRKLPEVVAENGAVLPDFRVIGGGTSLLSISVPGYASDNPAVHPRDVFLYDGRDLLQLTRFGRADTIAMFLGRRRRAVFATGADPLGTNPVEIPQVFSIDIFGRRLRQLTRLPGAPVPCGRFVDVFTCDQIVGVQDPVTDAIVFAAPCGGLRASTFAGQLFAVAPDGRSGVRQLTTAGGCVTNDDGSVTVEMPGPFGYSAPSR
jgi:hypothetical protein